MPVEVVSRPVVEPRRPRLRVASGVLNVPEARASMQAECLPYSPTALAAFSRNKDPSRMYRRSIAVPLWPVWP